MNLKPHNLDSYQSPSIERQCPLCWAEKSKLFSQDKTREYFQCGQCSFIYVPSRYHLPSGEEKSRYDLHENHPNDPAYRTFLSKLFAPMVERLPKGASGIDFGAGPGPTLSLMFSESGFPMEIYDPFYADNREVLNRTYDFLTCSETMEHFFDPKKEWELFLKLVKKGGWIGIMTERLEREEDFSNWFYKNDDTHVGFYSTKTFRWLAGRYGLAVEFQGSSVALFRV